MQVEEEFVQVEAAPSADASLHGRELSVIVITLLKGVMFQDNDGAAWTALLKLQPTVRDYVATMGLELYLDEAEGYAFLRTKPAESVEDAAVALPRLMRRQQLSFPVSLLLALLRRKMVELDTTGGATRLVLSLDEIVEPVRVFLPEGTNDAKFVNKIESHVNKIVELGFLREMKSQSNRHKTYEVTRLIKAFVDAQWLQDFDTKLALYQQHVKQIVGDTSDD